MVRSLSDLFISRFKRTCVSDLIYIGGVSRGIDSQAAALFMLNRYGSARVVLVNSSCVPGMEINWIDDVVAWAKADRGGRQNNLFRILPPPSCESRSGLCE